MTGYEEGGGEGIKNIQASDLSICIVGEKLLLIFSKATVARKRNNSKRCSQIQE